MRSAASAVLAVLLLALSLLPAGAQGAARRAQRQAPLGGVNIAGLEGLGRPGEPDGSIAQAARLHAGTVRVLLPWSQLQPSGPGSFDPRALAFVDHLMEDASRHGLRVIMGLYNTPCWASSAPASLVRSCVSGRSPTAHAWPPSSTGFFTAFATTLTQRYAADLAAVEIWNEPDQSNEHYWAGPRKAAGYVALVRAAYPALKRVAPAVPVLAGSIVGANGEFLRALYAAGFRGYYDGLSVHFYTLTVASLRSIRAVQSEYGDSAPLWLDEFGWSSCWPRYRVQQEQGCVTRGVQASNILNSIRLISQLPYVAAYLIYELQGTAAEDFGVLNGRGVDKPSFRALSAALSNPFAPPEPVHLRLSVRRGSIIAAGSGPVGDFMRLLVSLNGRPAYRAIFTLDRFNRFKIALPRVLGTHVTATLSRWGGGARSSARAAS